MRDETNPCEPSPCGPNSQCKEFNDQAVCSCLSNFIGSPPNCRPECMVSSECSLNKACLNNKCVDPCIGTCGINTNCQVINHSPICSCRPGFSGDPFTRCVTLPRKITCYNCISSFNLHYFSTLSCGSTRNQKPLYPIALWS